MPVPNLEKTWLFSVNNVVTSSAIYQNDFKALFLGIKNTMKTLVTGSPWTVIGSSDASTAGIDGTDRLTSLAKIVYATSGGRSWLVLQQSAIAPNYQILFDFSVSNAYDMVIKVSPAVGFSGGSTTASPTASDSITVNPEGIFSWYTLYYNNSTNYTPVMFNVWASDDGTATRIGCVHNGVPMGLLMFEKPKNVVSQWTNPSVSTSMIQYNYGNNAWEIHLYSESRFASAISGSTAWHTALVFSHPTYDATNLGVPNYLRGYNTFTTEYEMLNIGLYCTTIGRRGKQGDLSDIWVGHGSVPNGSTFPTDDSRKFVKWGIFILPWNGIDRVKMF